MLILGVNTVLNWLQITTGGRRYTCPTKEVNGERFFRFKGMWHKVMDYITETTEELVLEDGRLFSRKIKTK